MELIFHKKLTSILFVTAIIVVLILVCILLASLTQLSSLNAQLDALNERIAEAKTNQETLEKLLEDRESIDFVIKWAEENGRISDQDVQWLKDNNLL